MSNLQNTIWANVPEEDQSVIHESIERAYERMEGDYEDMMQQSSTFCARLKDGEMIDDGTPYLSVNCPINLYESLSIDKDYWKYKSLSDIQDSGAYHVLLDELESVVDGLDDKPIHMEIDSEDGNRLLVTSMKEWLEARTAWYEANHDDEEPPCPTHCSWNYEEWSYDELWNCLDVTLKGAFDGIRRFKIVSLDTSTDVVRISLQSVEE